MALAFRTKGYSGFAAKYSVFYDNKIAVATSANYGLAGNGRLYILSIQPSGIITPDTHFDTQDGLFDVAWSEIHENQLVTSSGDGSIKLFDAKIPTYPVAVWLEHQREVYCVNWNNLDKTQFLSSSWDGTVKIWDPSSKQSIVTLHSANGTFGNTSRSLTGDVNHAANNNPHTKPSAVPLTRSQQPGSNITNDQCVYQAKFSPSNPSVVASVSAASRLQLWDIRAPRPLTMDITCHSGLEALSVDFNKYRPTVLATTGVDKTIRIWDLRMINNKFPASLKGINSNPQNELRTVHFPARNVVWSPHSRTKLLSCGYDMQAAVWDDISDPDQLVARKSTSSGLVNTFNKHTEFVLGADWSLWGTPGWVVTTGWDEMVYVWNTSSRY